MYAGLILMPQFVMEEDDLFAEAVNFTSGIDFTISHTTDTARYVASRHFPIPTTDLEPRVASSSRRSGTWARCLARTSSVGKSTRP